MRFELNEEQKLIQGTARRIAKERVAPRAAEMDETGEFPHDIFEAFRDVELLGLTMPEQYGGSGSGVFALALAVEEIAKYCCAGGRVLRRCAIPTHTIVVGGTGGQQRDW